MLRSSEGIVGLQAREDVNLDDYNIWDFDNGNGIYDVVTPADMERWKNERYQLLLDNSSDTIEPGNDVPF